MHAWKHAKMTIWEPFVTEYATSSWSLSWHGQSCNSDFSQCGQDDHYQLYHLQHSCTDPSIAAPPLSLPPAFFEFHPGWPVSVTAMKAALKPQKRHEENVQEQQRKNFYATTPLHEWWQVTDGGKQPYILNNGIIQFFVISFNTQ